MVDFSLFQLANNPEEINSNLSDRLSLELHAASKIFRESLPFRQIKLTSDGLEIAPEDMTAADDEWTTTVNTGDWSGLSSKLASRRMTEHAESQGFGRGSITYKLETGASHASVTGARRSP